jgi:hypothetical protein
MVGRVVPVGFLQRPGGDELLASVHLLRDFRHLLFRLRRGPEAGHHLVSRAAEQETTAALSVVLGELVEFRIGRPVGKIHPAVLIGVEAVEAYAHEGRKNRHTCLLRFITSERGDKSRDPRRLSSE